MLLGEHPFEGKTQLEMADAMLYSELPPLPASVPAALREVVRRCEQRQREDRFGSVRELTIAVEAAKPSVGRVRWKWAFALLPFALGAGWLLAKAAGGKPF